MHRSSRVAQSNRAEAQRTPPVLRKPIREMRPHPVSFSGYIAHAVGGISWLSHLSLRHS